MVLECAFSLPPFTTNDKRGDYFDLGIISMIIQGRKAYLFI